MVQANYRRNRGGSIEHRGGCMHNRGSNILGVLVTSRSATATTSELASS